MPDIIGDDLPSVLDGTNPRIEGSLDITGAGRESSVCVSSAAQNSDTWLKTRMVTNPSHSSWNYTWDGQKLGQDFPFSRLFAIC